MSRAYIHSLKYIALCFYAWLGIKIYFYYFQSNEVQATLNILQNSRSKLLKLWKEIDVKITYCYNEAKDNAKFIQSMEKCCHSLYLDDPV